MLFHACLCILPLDTILEGRDVNLWPKGEFWSSLRRPAEAKIGTCGALSHQNAFRKREKVPPKKNAKNECKKGALPLGDPAPILPQTPS